jgi:hypothetical protein
LITYLDSSVVLRIILGSPAPLDGWQEIEHSISSRLLYVECQRTLERMRLAENKSADVIAIRKKTVEDLISAVDLFDVTKRHPGESWRAFCCVAKKRWMQFISPRLWRFAMNATRTWRLRLTIANSPVRLAL